MPLSHVQDRFSHRKPDKGNAVFNDFFRAGGLALPRRLRRGPPRHPEVRQREPCQVGATDSKTLPATRCELERRPISRGAKPPGIHKSQDVGSKQAPWGMGDDGLGLRAFPSADHALGRIGKFPCARACRGWDPPRHGVKQKGRCAENPITAHRPRIAPPEANCFDPSDGIDGFCCGWMMDAWRARALHLPLISYHFSLLLFLPSPAQKREHAEATEQGGGGLGDGVHLGQRGCDRQVIETLGCCPIVTIDANSLNTPKNEA